MNIRKNLLSICFVLVIWSTSVAEVRLPAVIGDNMVLQQKQQAAIWGWADAGEKVSVKGSWQWLATSAKADENGRWMVELKTPKAGGPYEVTVSGKNKITLKNMIPNRSARMIGIMRENLTVHHFVTKISNIYLLSISLQY